MLKIEVIYNIHETSIYSYSEMFEYNHLGNMLYNSYRRAASNPHIK